MKNVFLSLFFPLFFSIPASAVEYPDMVGAWSGHVRVVSSGTNVSDQVASGGAVLSELELTVTIDYQEGETFIGKSRASTTPREQASTPVWGAIRSTGDEAMFVTAAGGRGHLWLKQRNEFEYCITNLEETVITAYCGILNRKQRNKE